MSTDEMERLGRELLQAAWRPGEAVEVFLKRTWWHQTVRSTGGDRTGSGGMETGAGIRVFLPDGRWAHSHCSDPHPAAARAAAARAREWAAACREGEAGATLPSGPGVRRGADPPAPGEDGADFLAAVEEEIASADPPGGTVPVAICTDGATRIWLGNSCGFEGTFHRNLRHAVLGVRFPGSGEIAYFRRAATDPGQLPAAQVAGEAILRTTLPLRSPSLRPGRIPILIPPGPASELVRSIHRPFIGGGTVPGTGEAVGSRHFQLIDDGRLAGGIATAPFDGEGWETGRKVLVRDGVVVKTVPGTGAGAGTASRSLGNARGNRVRDSFREPPVVGPTNFLVPAGDRDPDRLAAEIGEGVGLLNWESLAGDPFAADRFTVGFSGYVIRGGEAAGGIRSGFLSGRRDLLFRGLAARGTDLRLYPLDGSFGSPTLVIEGLEVGPATA